MEYEDREGGHTIPPDSERPYVFIVPLEAENMVVYDMDGNTAEHPYDKE